MGVGWGGDGEGTVFENILKSYICAESSGYYPKQDWGRSDERIG